MNVYQERPWASKNIAKVRLDLGLRAYILLC